MNTILKTLLTCPTLRKIQELSNGYKNVFFPNTKSKEYKVFAFFESFVREFKEAPTFKNCCDYFEGINDLHTRKFLDEILNFPEAPVESDSDFFTYLKTQEIQQMESELRSLLFEMASNNDPMKDVQDVVSRIEEIQTRLTKIKQKQKDKIEAQSGCIFGPESTQELLDQYSDIVRAKEEGGELYYDIGLGPAFKDVLLKRGDLVPITAFSSHGKSLLSRYICHHLATKHGLNVAFFSLEMSYKQIRPMITILHSADKRRFPKTPELDYAKFRNGEFTKEEIEFMAESNTDLAENESYGVFYIEQPEELAFTFEDLKQRLDDISRNLFPIDVVCIDYLTLMSPNKRGKSEMSDYNQLVKNIKRLALTYKAPDGTDAPFICITPAQSNRDSFNQMMAALRAQQNETSDDKKQQGGVFAYTPSCVAQYSELYASADVMITAWLDQEVYKPKNMSMIQCIKNRESATVEPQDLYIDFKSGVYSTIKQEKKESLVTRLRSLQL